MKHPHRTLLIMAWIVLIAWGAGLVYWWQQQNLRANRVPETALAIVPATGEGPPAAPVTDPDGSSDGQAKQLALSTISLEREPGPAARSGDYLTLARAFDGVAAQDHITRLAAPPFDGRRAGTEGGYAAAEYLAGQFARFDLQPAGDLLPDGSRSYFQEFPLDFFVAYTDPPVLEIFGADGRALGPYRFRTDYSSSIGSYAGQGEAEGPVVWVNYCTHDDFDVVDATNAVVLCRLGGEEDVTRNAIEHGASGLLLVGEPETGPIDRIGRYNPPLVPAPLPTFVIDPAVVGDLVQDSGYTFNDLTIQFDGLPLRTRAHLLVELEQKDNATGRNVIGIIPGADPDHVAEVVIVGAHYDHMGSDPDGLVCTREAAEGAETCRRSPATVYWGANDNASGVAALLEIAHLWQMAGYSPSRTVIFAAWDAEEQGLWGSTHFVQNPVVPLTDTVAYLNLDMVGAGTRSLSIDGPGPIADQLIALAPTFGISTTLEDSGRSDHIPFQTAGVNATMMIWFAEGEDSTVSLAHYHRPVDRPEVIEPDKLQAAGELASLTLFTLASVQPELEDLVAQRSAALASGDRNALLATTAGTYRAADEAWWDMLTASEPERATLSLENPVVVGDVATATLRYQVQSADSDFARRADDIVRFHRTSDGDPLDWRLDGPALDSIQGSRLTLFYPPGEAERAGEVLDILETRYQELAGRITGRLPTAQGRVYLHPSKERMQAAIGLSLPQNVDLWANGSSVHLTDQVNITRTDTLTTAMTQLVLAQAGLREAQAPWLWHGLPLQVAGDATRQGQPASYLSSLQGMLKGEVPFSIGDFPSIRASQGGTSAWEAAAWATSGHLLEVFGDDALGRLVEELAKVEPDSPQQSDRAFQNALGISVSDFDAGWQTAWRNHLESAQRQMDDLLDRRVQAVGVGDRAAFLGLIDATNPSLVAEESGWFDAVQANPLRSFQLEGTLIGVTPDSVQAQVQATWETENDDDVQRTTYELWLPRRDDHLVYGGPKWLELHGEGLTILYREVNAELAEALLPLAESTYATIASRLDISPRPAAVKLFNNDQELRLALDPAFSGESMRSAGTSQSIRALVKSNDRAEAAADVRNSLLDGMVESLLLQAGVGSGDDTRWLRNGLGRLALEWVDPSIGWQQAARLAGKVPLAAQKGEFWSLATLPPFDALSAGERSLAEAQSLDATRYLLNAYGLPGLRAVIQELSQGMGSLDQAMTTALGISLSGFEQNWLESAETQHVSAEWIDLAKSFDADAALLQALDLAGESYEGREIGTAGGRRTAVTIAEAFETIGLEPLGPDGSFFQRFAISQTQPVASPSLVLQQEDDSLALSYRDDFVEVFAGHGLGGEATGPLIWVRDPEYTDMRLEGKVVLRSPDQELKDELSKATAAGASALILVSSAGPHELRSRSPINLSEVVTPTLPVVQLTKRAFEGLMDFAGVTLRDLNTAPNALRLGLNAQVDVPLSDPAVADGINVLGLWPGTDAALADQLVVVSAHYDGTGRDASGTSYPGANDNASGVAALLEIARTWQAAGVQPGRSVLFAAWDGDELGQVGSRAYVAEPALPLTQTLGVLNLDAVGAGQGFFLTYESDRSREALLNWAVSTASGLLGSRADLVAPEDTGDHSVFQEAGVPAVLFTWDSADDDANTWLDTPDELDLVKLRRTGEIVSLSLRWLAQ